MEQIRALPRGLNFEQIESATSFEHLNRDRSLDKSNSCQINWCPVTTWKFDYPAIAFFVLAMAVGLALVNVVVILKSQISFPTEMSLGE